jgi:hypothetical protein
MDKFDLVLSLGHAAFYDDDGDFDPSLELARILRVVARQVELGAEAGKAYDANGNKVGYWEVKP